MTAMDITVPIPTVLALIFGTGGLGAVTVMVSSYRRLKTGKIGDEDSIIRRLYVELQRQEKRAEDAEDERNGEAVLRSRWREQAWTYRLQLMKAHVVPDDDPRLWGGDPGESSPED